MSFPFFLRVYFLLLALGLCFPLAPPLALGLALPFAFVFAFPMTLPPLLLASFLMRLSMALDFSQCCPRSRPNVLRIGANESLIWIFFHGECQMGTGVAKVSGVACESWVRSKEDYMRQFHRHRINGGQR